MLLICSLLANELLVVLGVRRRLLMSKTLVGIVVVVALRLYVVGLVLGLLFMILILRLLRVTEVGVADEVLVVLLVALEFNVSGNELVARLLLYVVHHILVLLILVRRVIGITLLLILALHGFLLLRLTAFSVVAGLISLLLTLRATLVGVTVRHLLICILGICPPLRSQWLLHRFKVAPPVLIAFNLLW